MDFQTESILNYQTAGGRIIDPVKCRGGLGTISAFIGNVQFISQEFF